MVDQICSRIARYNYDLIHGNGSYEKLEGDAQRCLIEQAWRGVFKNTEWGDPHYSIRSGRDELTREYKSLDDAKEKARALIDDQHTIIDIVEVVERRVTAFYQHVVKTVVEDEGE